MTREDLIRLLEAHAPFNEHEAVQRERVLRFVQENARCFERSLLTGHVTASAWVVNPAMTHALLTYHAKLNRWLQLGGHCDGDADVLRAALREVREESGLRDLTPLLGGRIFDVDAHAIPARKLEPEHVHYDIRFLLSAKLEESLQLSGESHELAWVELGKVSELNTDESVLRMLARTRLLKTKTPAP